MKHKYLLILILLSLTACSKPTVEEFTEEALIAWWENDTT